VIAEHNTGSTPPTPPQSPWVDPRYWPRDVPSVLQRACSSMETQERILKM